MREDKVKKLVREIEVNDLSEALIFPRFFEIETVNTCNASCAMCTIKSWKNKGASLMSEELWNKFVAEIKPYARKMNRVTVARDGEPLLDKKLESKIKDLKRIKIGYVTFATNCSLLNQGRACSLLDSGLDDIMFSIDGFTKQTYEKIRKGLNFEQVVENCINFIKARDAGNYKTTVRVRMVLQDENIKELAPWTGFWKPLLKNDDRVYAKPAHSWGNQLKNYADITKDINKKDYSGELCVGPWSTMVIKVNGDVPLCPVDFNCRFNMGNFAKSTIKQIWSAEGFNRVRDKMLAGERNDLILCKDCWLWDRSTTIER